MPDPRHDHDECDGTVTTDLAAAPTRRSLRGELGEKGIGLTDLRLDDRGAVITVAPALDPLSISDLPEIGGAETGARGARLRLGEAVGAGGMGAVRLATQLPLDRRVAVKTTLPGS